MKKEQPLNPLDPTENILKFADRIVFSDERLPIDPLAHKTLAEQMAQQAKHPPKEEKKG